MHANPLVAQSRSRSHSPLGSDFVFYQSKKVYSQIRSFSIAARVFLPFVHMCRWKNLALEKRCPLRYTLDEVSA